MTVTEAHSAVTKAEEKLAEAEVNLEHARNNLDAALAARGWRRMMGGFEGRLYSRLGGEAVPLDAILEHEKEAVA
jgi:hypothetical protein